MLSMEGMQAYHPYTAYTRMVVYSSSVHASSTPCLHAVLVVHGTLADMHVGHAGHAL